MSITALAFLLSSALYTGFQWTIRVLVYPQFDAVPAPAFVDYEGRHQRRVSFAVGPLFAALGVASVAVFVHPPAVSSRLLAPRRAGAVGAILALTALAAVPLHSRLGAGFDATAYRRLLAVDSARLACAAAATVVGDGPDLTELFDLRRVDARRRSNNPSASAQQLVRHEQRRHSDARRIRCGRS